MKMFYLLQKYKNFFQKTHDLILNMYLQLNKYYKLNKYN